MVFRTMTGKKHFALQIQRFSSRSYVMAETNSFTRRALIVTKVTQLQAFCDTPMASRMDVESCVKPPTAVFDFVIIGDIDNKCEDNIQILSSEHKTTGKAWYQILFCVLLANERREMGLPVLPVRRADFTWKRESGGPRTWEVAVLK
jgi:hypothetical protein